KAPHGNGAPALLTHAVRAFFETLEGPIHLGQQAHGVLLEAYVHLAGRDPTAKIGRVLVVSRELADAARFRVHPSGALQRLQRRPQPAPLLEQPRLKLLPIAWSESHKGPPFPLRRSGRFTGGPTRPGRCG